MERNSATNQNPNYEIVGTGNKTMVFIHYFGGDAGSWKWLAKRLQKRYTCVLLNLPGFGGNTPIAQPSIYEFSQFINACIDELNLKEYTLCGHSMGGKLALYAAQMMKGVKPSNIVLIAPSPPTVEDMEEQERDRMLIHPNAEEALKTVRGATIKKLEKKRFAYALESQMRIDENTWDWWLTKGMRNNIADRVESLKIPTYVIFSKDDPVIAPEAIYSEVLPHLKKPSFTALTKVGHLIPMESPRKLARLLKRFGKDQISPKQ
ncbi:hypothetical protein LCGC14_0665930 [marine sediment metagenome]|uniref:Alpha/beta hydrolase n=2 Tax=root TaxID=1 RepID=A0A831QR96_9FLAO|nr:alpha/beta hydrolase [Pricia antarctica]